VIIPLKNEGVKLKKYKKSGLEKLIHFQMNNYEDGWVNADVFRSNMKFKGNYRSIMD
jgi:hypothetical protein